MSSGPYTLETQIIIIPVVSTESFVSLHIFGFLDNESSVSKNMLEETAIRIIPYCFDQVKQSFNFYKSWHPYKRNKTSVNEDKEFLVYHQQRAAHFPYDTIGGARAV